MNVVSIARGKAKWAEADCLMVQALAYKEAAAAAQVVDETEIATALSHKASDHETKAHHLYRDAKALGYFGGVSADPV